MTGPQLRFDGLDEAADPSPMALGPGAWLLPAFLRADAAAGLAAIAAIAEQAPFRRMTTPGGKSIGVAMTNCGALGWVSDRSGYGYAPRDPESGRPWPAMPPAWRDLAEAAARAGGYDNFAPDACLINAYAPGVGMSLHQDRDESDFGQPIVSVSLGLPAIFLWGGATRRDKPQRVPLHHGDVLVWGGPDRLRFHGVAKLNSGVAKLKTGRDPIGQGLRYNLTFRRAR